MKDRLKKIMRNHKYLVRIFALIGAGVFDALVTNILIYWDFSGSMDSRVFTYGKIDIREWVGFILAIEALIFGVRRMNHNADTKLFNSAIKQLNSDVASARTSAIISLHGIAMNSERLRGEIAQILCSHICSTTQKEEYQNSNKYKPSVEIQKAINLLFRNIDGVEGLYKRFNSELPRGNLSYAYLRGANFSHALCVDVTIIRTDLTEAIFISAVCEKMYFETAEYYGLFIWNAKIKNCWITLGKCNYDFPYE